MSASSADKENRHLESPRQPAPYIFSEEETEAKLYAVRSTWILFLNSPMTLGVRDDNFYMKSTETKCNTGKISHDRSRLKSI